jgi:uncharacterized membrane protein YcaP (DUF421 family)
MSQLEAAARKQGFDSLGDVQQCVLEAGGTISFIGKKPGTDETRHRALLERFDKLMGEIATLRGERPPAKT